MDRRTSNASPAGRRKSARETPDQSPNWQRMVAAKDANTAIGEMRQRCLDARSTEQVDEALDLLNTHLQEGMMGPREFGEQFNYLWNMKLQLEGKATPIRKGRGTQDGPSWIYRMGGLNLGDQRATSPLSNVRPATPSFSDEDLSD